MTPEDEQPTAPPIDGTPDDGEPDDGKPGEVLVSGGEASAVGYVEAVVPEGTDCPTIEVARVRIVPPSQTPTVRVADVTGRPGPRAPEQRVKPRAKGPVELPEGRPVTKMQRIEIDPEFLLGLEQGLIEGHAGDVATPAPAEPVSAPVAAKPKRRSVLMLVAIAVTAGVVALAAMRPVRGPAPGAAVVPVPSATATPSATVMVAPSALPPVMVVPSATESVVPVATASVAPAAASAHGSAPAAPRDPYDDPPVTAPSAHPVASAPAPPAVAPKLPGGDKTEF